MSNYNNISSLCLKLLKNNDTKKHIKDIVKPIFFYILNEFKIYIFFFIFFILTNFLLHLGILLLLLKYNKKINNKFV